MFHVRQFHKPHEKHLNGYEVCSTGIADFTDIKYNFSQQMPTYDQPYLDRIFCHYKLMKIIFPMCLRVDYGCVDFLLFILFRQHQIRYFILFY